MNEKIKDNKDILEGDDLSTIILDIPQNAVKLDIVCKCIDDNDEFFKCKRTINLPEIVDLRIVGEEWTEENAKYVLTDKYKENMGE